MGKIKLPLIVSGVVVTIEMILVKYLTHSLIILVVIILFFILFNETNEIDGDQIIFERGKKGKIRACCPLSTESVE